MILEIVINNKNELFIKKNGELKTYNTEQMKIIREKVDELQYFL